MMDKNYKNIGKVLMLMAVPSLTVMIPFSRYVKIVREERAKRQKIDANLQKSLSAIDSSYHKVIERLENGEYNSGGGFAVNLRAMLTDLEFEQIIEFNKD